MQLGFNYKAPKIDLGLGSEPERDSRRTLGIGDRQKVYLRDKKRCQVCEKKLDFTDAQFGHKKAWSKGGSTTIGNTVLLCYGCNKRQGTGSLDTLKRELGLSSKKSKRVRATSKKRKRKGGDDLFGNAFDIKPVSFPFKSSKNNPFGL